MAIQKIRSFRIGRAGTTAWDAGRRQTGFEDVENLDVSNFRIMSIGDLSTDFNQRWDSEIATLH